MELIATFFFWTVTCPRNCTRRKKRVAAITEVSRDTDICKIHQHLSLCTVRRHQLLTKSQKYLRAITKVWRDFSTRRKKRLAAITKAWRDFSTRRKNASRAITKDMEGFQTRRKNASRAITNAWRDSAYGMRRTGTDTEGGQQGDRLGERGEFVAKKWCKRRLCNPKVASSNLAPGSKPPTHHDAAQLQSSPFDEQTDPFRRLDRPPVLIQYQLTEHSFLALFHSKGGPKGGHRGGQH